MNEGIDYAYLQLADTIAERIQSGDLSPNTALPGEIALSAQYEVSIGTVRRAVNELRWRGLVVTLPAKGTFVAPIDGEHQ